MKILHIEKCMRKNGVDWCMDILDVFVTAGQGQRLQFLQLQKFSLY